MNVCFFFFFLSCSINNYKAYIERRRGRNPKICNVASTNKANVLACWYSPNRDVPFSKIHSYHFNFSGVETLSCFRDGQSCCTTSNLYPRHYHYSALSVMQFISFGGGGWEEMGRNSSAFTFYVQNKINFLKKKKDLGLLLRNAHCLLHDWVLLWYITWIHMKWHLGKSGWLSFESCWKNL